MKYFSSYGRFARSETFQLIIVRNGRFGRPEQLKGQWVYACHYVLCSYFQNEKVILKIKIGVHRKMQLQNL